MQKKYLLSVLVLVTMWSCSEGDPLHIITNTRVENGGIVSDTLYALADTSIVKGKISTANSKRLLLGQNSGFETRFLIRFGQMPDDTIKVDSLRLLLTSVANFGETAAPIQGSAYLVTEDWPESVNEDADWDFRSKIDQTEETTAHFEINADAKQIHSIDLPPALVDVWRDTTGGGKNFGILVDFNSATNIKEFSSVDALLSGQRPRLVVTYTDTGLDSIMHDTLFVNKDASLIEFIGTLNPTDLVVASGYAVQSYLKFDFSHVPSNAILSTMNMIIKRDTLNSLINENRTEEMYLRLVRNSYDELPVAEIDSSFMQNVYYNVSMVDNDAHELSIDPLDRGPGSQRFIQEILNGETPYGSFLLHYKNEGEDISIYKMIDEKTSDPDERPRLIIEYYLVPEARL